MAEPFELLAAPFDIYLAPAGEAKPDIDATPAGNWVLLGTRGADSYDEAGVTAKHEQAVNLHRGLRGTGPAKAFRMSEGLVLSLVLDDMTLEAYAVALNAAAVTDVVHARSVSFHMGAEVATYALLAKSAHGPYGDDMPIQYYVPKCFQSGSPSVVHVKGKAAGLALEFTALEDLAADTEEERFGVLEAQDSAS